MIKLRLLQQIRTKLKTNGKHSLVQGSISQINSILSTDTIPHNAELLLLLLLLMLLLLMLQLLLVSTSSANAIIAPGALLAAGLVGGRNRGRRVGIRRRVRPIVRVRWGGGGWRRRQRGLAGGFRVHRVRFDRGHFFSLVHASKDSSFIDAREPLNRSWPRVVIPTRFRRFCCLRFGPFVESDYFYLRVFFLYFLLIWWWNYCTASR